MMIHKLGRPEGQMQFLMANMVFTIYYSDDLTRTAMSSLGSLVENKSGGGTVRTAVAELQFTEVGHNETRSILLTEEVTMQFVKAMPKST